MSTSQSVALIPRQTLRPAVGMCTHGLLVLLIEDLSDQWPIPLAFDVSNCTMNCCSCKFLEHVRDVVDL